jgi:hypothetical protein
MAGEHFFDGFIRAYRKDQAKETIEKLLNRLNEGEAIAKADFERGLKPFTPA